MTGFENDWQTKILTIKERIKFVFNNELMSDVKFYSSSNVETNKMVIPAHKFVLGLSSPVFYAMFYGQMAETVDSIELPDCNYESLLELFHYLYTDEVNLTGNNVMEIYYLAKKYMIPSLVQNCIAYVRDNVQGSNVFSVLLLAKIFEEKALEDRCWGVIKTQTTEAVTSEDFVTLERSLVESVVNMDRLFVKEVELFKAVDLWSTKAIERRGLTHNGKTKREILGEEIVKAIRFPLMSQMEFMAVVPDTNILTVEEVVVMMKYYSNVLETPLPFIQSPRSGLLQWCKRLNTAHGTIATGSFSDDVLNCSISFINDKPIFLHGVQLFGQDIGNYIVNVKVVEDDMCGFLLYKQSGIHLSVTYKDTAIRFISYLDVMFDHPVCLESGKTYKILSSIKGPLGYYIKCNLEIVECSGVTFTFKKDTNVAVDSDQISCQFPALIFSL